MITDKLLLLAGSKVLDIAFDAYKKQQADKAAKKLRKRLKKQQRKASKEL